MMGIQRPVQLIYCVLVYVWLEILRMFQGRKEFIMELIAHRQVLIHTLLIHDMKLTNHLFIKSHLSQQGDTNSGLWVGFPMPYPPLLNILPKLLAEYFLEYAFCAMVFRIFLKGVESGMMKELRAATALPYA